MSETVTRNIYEIPDGIYERQLAERSAEAQTQRARMVDTSGPDLDQIELNIKEHAAMQQALGRMETSNNNRSGTIQESKGVRALPVNPREILLTKAMTQPDQAVALFNDPTTYHDIYDPKRGIDTFADSLRDSKPSLRELSLLHNLAENIDDVDAQRAVRNQIVARLGISKSNIWEQDKAVERVCRLHQATPEDEKVVERLANRILEDFTNNGATLLRDLKRSNLEQDQPASANQETDSPDDPSATSEIGNSDSNDGTSDAFEGVPQDEIDVMSDEEFHKRLNRRSDPASQTSSTPAQSTSSTPGSLDGGGAIHPMSRTELADLTRAWSRDGDQDSHPSAPSASPVTQVEPPQRAQGGEQTATNPADATSQQPAQLSPQDSLTLSAISGESIVKTKRDKVVEAAAYLKKMGLRGMAKRIRELAELDTEPQTGPPRVKTRPVSTPKPKKQPIIVRHAKGKQPKPGALATAARGTLPTVDTSTFFSGFSSPEDTTRQVTSDDKSESTNT